MWLVTLVLAAAIASGPGEATPGPKPAVIADVAYELAGP